MQALISAAAEARVRTELDRIAPRLEVIALGEGGVFTRGGRRVEAAEIDPEIFWSSLDVFVDGLMGDLARVLLKGTRGQWVQVAAAGLDDPFFKRLMAKGLRLTKGRGQAPPIAEYVLAHALGLLHPIARQAAAQQAHHWRRISFREVGQTRWLLVGYGEIGRAVAERVKPFGAHITAVRRTAGAPDALVDEVAAQSDLPRLLPQADVVVLACPLNEETRGLADAAFFAAFKPGALLINIGRGELVDEQALRQALDAGVVGTAVLDVVRTEPLPADAWLWDHPRVRVTAHTSNAGEGVVERGDAQFLDNLRRFLAGEPLRNEARPAEVGL